MFSIEIDQKVGGLVPQGMHFHQIYAQFIDISFCLRCLFSNWWMHFDAHKFGIYFGGTKTTMEKKNMKWDIERQFQFVAREHKAIDRTLHMY